ncbi:MAG: hypothetical protein KFB97_13220 [Cyanobium sp. M30B3]|nr:MAG: hypothetical protein KFB97_13220 [Cyanobium sp. M30B3]
MRSSSSRVYAAAGFTLVELLVTIGIASAVTLGITALLNADLRSNITLLQFQRLRRQASHARRFIELEASQASQLQVDPDNPHSLELRGVLPSDGSTYEIRYEIVDLDNVEQAGVAFRGPFVLQRIGPPYTAAGVLDDTANQSLVILDGLVGLEAFTVQSQAGSSRGALVRIDINDADSTYNPEFALSLATSPALGVLLSPSSAFDPNCTGTPAPAGCRNDGTIQEWDTRTSGTSITPVGTPEQVIVYFNGLKPSASNAIRRTASTNPVETCIRTSCYVEVNGTGYTINTRVDKLVFTDEVVAVPPF